MIEWLSSHPLIAGVVTFFLAWADWLLTILQERERQLHYADHYQSYPVNTIEGNQRYQSTVNAKRIIEPRHLLPALVMTGIVTVALVWIPEDFRPLLLGYVWGLYLIVSTTHLGNLLGYRAGRHGLHGKIYLHQRTGYLMQMGRYFALSVLQWEEYPLLSDSWYGCERSPRSMNRMSCRPPFSSSDRKAIKMVKVSGQWSASFSNSPPSPLS